MALNRLRKGHSPHTRAETRSQMIALFASAGNVCVEELKFFTALQMSADDCKSVTSTDLGITNKC